MIGKPGPFQIIEGEGVGLVDAPVAAPRRRYSCNNYATCLDLAAALNWDNFTCRGCNGEVNQNLLWRGHQAKRRDDVAESLCTLPELGPGEDAAVSSSAVSSRAGAGPSGEAPAVAFSGGASKDRQTSRNQLSAVAPNRAPELDILNRFGTSIAAARDFVLLEAQMVGEKRHSARRDEGRDVVLDSASDAGEPSVSELAKPRTHSRRPATLVRGGGLFERVAGGKSQARREYRSRPDASPIALVSRAARIDKP